jgi:hypothetical protein
LKNQEGHYEKPQIVDHGELTDLTAGKTTGTQIDATFVIHSPLKTILTHLTVP